jgi:hypothetical protein
VRASISPANDGAAQPVGRASAVGAAADRALATAAAGDPTVTVYDDGSQTPACRLRFRLGADENTICYDRPIHT